MGAWLNAAGQALVRAGVESPHLSIHLFLEEVTGLSRSSVIAHPERTLEPNESERLEELLARRLDHEPTAYILGWKDFRNLRLKVSSAVLIPRPETEELVDLAKDLMPHALDILDVATGSGCIALSLLETHRQGRIRACDLSEAALEVARQNDQERRIGWFRSDWFECVRTGSLDLIVSNPPYVTDAEMSLLDPQVARYEPQQALRGGADGCDAYRKILPQAASCLRPGGRLIVEASPAVAHPLRQIFEEHGFVRIEVHRDLAGRERFATGLKPGRE
jgi:release factor glutamine methyltransferase